jgi:hypothetical protein
VHAGRRVALPLVGVAVRGEVRGDLDCYQANVHLYTCVCLFRLLAWRLVLSSNSATSTSSRVAKKKKKKKKKKILALNSVSLGSTGNSVEATFRAYLADLGAVCGVSVRIDEQAPLDAKLTVRDEDMSVAESELHELNPERDHDLFACRVGTLAPDQSVTFSVAYVSELFVRGDVVRFVVPTAFAERVDAAAAAAIAMQLPPRRPTAPPAGSSVALELDLSVEMPSAIERIESVTHGAALKVALTGTRATVQVRTNENAALDVALAVHIAQPRQSFVAIERSADRSSASLMATFFPRFQAPPLAVELVFLVDCSPTMLGAPLARAQDVMRLCLAQMPSGAYFNVVSFGAKAACLFPDSVEATSESVSTARAFVDALAVDDGESDVYLVLKSVQKTNSVRADRAKQVVLVTDGIISYTIDVLDTVREMAPTTRTFVFDIGAGLSHHVAQAIARAGLGDVEYAADLEPLDAKVKRQLARACQPRPSSVAVRFEHLPKGVACVVSPAAVHTLFDGDAVVVHALLDTRADTDDLDSSARRSMSAEPGPLTDEVLRGVVAHLSAQTSGGVDVEAHASASGILGEKPLLAATLHLLAATERIHDLVGNETLEEEQFRAQVTRVALRFNLASPYTAFVAQPIGDAVPATPAAPPTRSRRCRRRPAAARRSRSAARFAHRVGQHRHWRHRSDGRGAGQSAKVAEREAPREQRQHVDDGNDDERRRRRQRRRRRHRLPLQRQ